jgi:hypothetical protein
MNLKNALKNPSVRRVGGPVAHLVARNYIGEGKPLDIPLGMALFRDKRVPVAAKMGAMAIGFAAMMLWNVLELPVEALIAFLLPLVGLGIEIAWNGAQTIIGSLLFASLALPHIAPKTLVQKIRAERNPVPVPITER